MAHRRLLDLLGFAIAGAGAGARRLGAERLWPFRLFSLDKDRAEIAVGARAPTFRLESAAGGEVSLADLAARGTPVLVFYRGHW